MAVGGRALGSGGRRRSAMWAHLLAPHICLETKQKLVRSIEIGLWRRCHFHVPALPRRRPTATMAPMVALG
jgi:hypothetical protein